LVIAAVLLTTVLRLDWAQYSFGPWWANNNVWGRDSLINGVDYTQSITINDSTFPNDTVLYWSWPSKYRYYAFPEIVYGSSPYQSNPHGQQTSRLTDITDLSVNFSIALSDNARNYDVTFDLWLTTQPNGGPNSIKYELQIVVYAPPGWGPGSYESPAYTLADPGPNNVYVTPRLYKLWNYLDKYYCNAA
jgi:hypothetical protein